MKKTKRPKFGIYRKNNAVEGEPIEHQIRRMVDNGEDLESNKSKPIIYTDRKDGVIAAYDPRADKWDIALDGVDKINKSRDAKAKGETTMKVVKNEETPEAGKETGASL